MVVYCVKIAGILLCIGFMAVVFTGCIDGCNEDPVVTAIDVFPRDNLIANGFSNGQVIVKTYPGDVIVWESRGERQHEDEITSLSFSPDGNYIVSADETGEILLWPFFARNEPRWDAWRVRDKESDLVGIGLLSNDLLYIRTRNGDSVLPMEIEYQRGKGWILLTPR